MFISVKGNASKVISDSAFRALNYITEKNVWF